MEHCKHGMAHDTGDGQVQKYSDAVSWYLKSAGQGHAKAQNSLGRMYAGGVGVERNCLLAYMWFSLAAAQGEANSMTGRDVVESKMTAAQIAEGKKLVSEWKPKPKRPPGT